MNRKPAYGRLIFILVGIVAGFLVGFFADLETRTESLRIIATVFSILYGMLLGIFALHGDPNNILAGSSRIAILYRHELKHKLKRYTMFSYIYLVTITLIVFVSIVGWPYDNMVLYRFTVGFATMALVWSFALPHIIHKAQVARYDKEVEDRREKERKISDSQAEGSE